MAFQDSVGTAIPILRAKYSFSFLNRWAWTDGAKFLALPYAFLARVNFTRVLCVLFKGLCSCDPVYCFVIHWTQKLLSRDRKGRESASCIVV